MSEESEAPLIIEDIQSQSQSVVSQSILHNRKSDNNDMGKFFYITDLNWRLIFFFNFLDDSFLDDSLNDMFHKSQSKLRKKLKAISVTAPPKLNDEFPVVIVFKWGGNSENPFELCDMSQLDDVDTKLLNGILSPKSRQKQRRVEAYPEFSVSIFSKIDKSEFMIILFFLNIELLLYNIYLLLLGTAMKRRREIVKDLNANFRRLVANSTNPIFKVEDALEMMIQEKPYRVFHDRTYDNKGEFIKSQRDLKKV